ncbi:MAG: IPTL-CTERM sorting domain-containing protein [Desulfosalsimonadaceae bacterium]|nr:IPTL-CTERM sorting domain-containing protein [Desulfosalsimonadaceae bacterium]
MTSHEVTDAAPTIDGVVGPGEWPGTPQIEFSATTPPSPPYTYVIPTRVYFYNDLSNIYVLVDAGGDTTADSGDECLLIFGNGSQYIVPEGFGLGNVSYCTPQGIVFSAGFSTTPTSPDIPVPHRIYEWRIPFSAIGASPGQQIDFCSPHYWKFQCPVEEGSLGYDATTGNDNIWPPGLIGVPDPNDRDDWGTLRLQPTQPRSIPTLSEWGMILMGLALAGAAVRTLKRRDALSM